MGAPAYMPGPSLFTRPGEGIILVHPDRPAPAPEPVAGPRTVTPMLTSPRFARLRPVAPLLSLVALCTVAACGDDDVPVGPVAALSVTASQLDALAEKLEPIAEQPVFDGFLMMRFGRGLPFDSEVFFPLGGAAERASVTAAPTDVASQFVPRLPSIPDTLRGRTLVRDSMSLGWTIDRLADGTPRPGAPADGLRFVLSSYFTPGPSSSSRVGTMDMTQQGTGTGTRFTTDVRDVQGAHVLHYSASLSGTTSAGWVSHGSTRVDQLITFTGGGNRRVRWTSAGIPFEAERIESRGTGSTSIVHVLPIAGARLRLVSTMAFTSMESTRTTYTVYLGDAPFARRVDVLDMTQAEGAWRHVGEDRPLTEGEQAQVRAFLRVLIAIPDAEAAWQEGLMDLMTILYPSPPF